MSSVIESIQCNESDELLEQLSHRGFTADAERGDWLFRGHSVEKYQLIADSLRPERREHLYHLAGLDPSVDDTGLNQIVAEIEVFSRFWKRCDEAGLNVPGDCSAIREDFRSVYDKFKSGLAYTVENWPGPRVYEILALARHYTLPTRLLDWSESGYTSLYFAAKSAAGKFLGGPTDSYDPKSERVIVWALRRSVIDAFDYGQSYQNRIIELVGVPRSSNVHLQAQRGVFTMMRPKDDVQSTRVPLDQFLTETTFPNIQKIEKPWLYKFSLPHNQSLDCVQQLWALGIDDAAIMPTYAGVVASMETAARFSKLRNT